MSSTFNHGYALLIGVGTSAYPRLSLPVTVQDMQALKRVLVNPSLCAYPDTEAHVQLLHDQGATQQAILNGLTWLKRQAVADPAATVIVYYSGHGWLDTKTDQYYLLPHDVDPFDWQNTALAATRFKIALREIPAQRLLVIIDCCHAQGMASPKQEEATIKLPINTLSTAAPKGLIEELGQGEGRVVFTSCQGKQQSWVRHDRTLSLYTHHLIEALQGAANQPGEIEVKISNLMNHLGKSVSASAQAINVEQTPHFELDAEDFAISLLHGGKGLPAVGLELLEDQASEQSQNFSQTITQHGDGNINIGIARNVSINR